MGQIPPSTERISCYYCCYYYNVIMIMIAIMFLFHQALFLRSLRQMNY